MVADEVVAVAHDAGGADGDRPWPTQLVRGAEDDALLKSSPPVLEYAGSAASGGTARRARRGRPVAAGRSRQRRQSGRSWNSIT
jgi:hypothetical protein